MARDETHKTYEAMQEMLEYLWSDWEVLRHVSPLFGPVPFRVRCDSPSLRYGGAGDDRTRQAGRGDTSIAKVRGGLVLSSVNKESPTP